MKINKEIRKYVIELIIRKLEERLSELDPYGYVSPMEYLQQIEYWETKLNIN